MIEEFCAFCGKDLKNLKLTYGLFMRLFCREGCRDLYRNDVKIKLVKTMERIRYEN